MSLRGGKKSVGGLFQRSKEEEVVEHELFPSYFPMQATTFNFPPKKEDEKVLEEPLFLFPEQGGGAGFSFVKKSFSTRGEGRGEFPAAGFIVHGGSGGL